MNELDQDDRGMVFIIDDEYYIRDSLSLLIQSRHLQCELFSSSESFLEKLLSYDPLMVATVLLDVRMNGVWSGMKLFQRLRDQEVIWPVIFLTGHGHVEMAVEAMKSGAFDFIEKPFNSNRLLDVVLSAVDECRNRICRFTIRQEILKTLYSLDSEDRQIFMDLMSRCSSRGDCNFSVNDNEYKVLRIFNVSSLPDFYALLDSGDVRADNI
ncbi:response regulator transcription factor [Candidatus Ichthyocystis hellenicum]|uniref:response regulator transcription factor n=1 Tax=Candidatus Ichthyocystis hellenicum TaxID=1561003 RepID=UPI000B844B35|nr:response regulator [Candidatus Ichthyocystis hellenicum]